MATTSVANTFKKELMMGAHCFLAVTTQTASGVNGAFTLTGMASTAGIAVGMAVTGSNVAAGAVVASVDSATQVTVSKAHTGTITTQTITFTGDAFKFLLIKVSPSGTYDKTLQNVGTPGSSAPSTTNVGTDEVANGSGYATNGFALTNTSPSLSTDTATITFSSNPSWTSASFSTTSGVLYNTSARLGAAATPFSGRVCSNHDFGGTQTVSAGTFTAVLPTNDASNAILRIA